MPHAHIRRFILLWLLLTAVLTGACQADLLDSPRLATATAQSMRTPTPTAAPLQVLAPTATPAADTRPSLTDDETGRKPSLTVWIDETSPEHAALMNRLADDYTAATGVDLSLQLVSPNLLPQLVNTAVLSDTLPDIILHPIEYSAGWADRGILNPDAATQALEALGRETFDPAALALLDQDGRPAGLPSEGHHQLWLYRADWFEERNLDVPDTYGAMLAGAERLFDPDNLVSGLVVPTESNLTTTHDVFEQMAIANGCQLINAAGEVTLLEQPCRDALDFYFSIINQYSPPGVQTDTSARTAFLEGRTGLIMAAPDVLRDVAEADLVPNTGILTELTGSSATAAPENLGKLSVLGITSGADVDTAVSFATFWFEEAYPQWLAVSAERKVPLRLGTADAPRRFIDDWGNAPLTGNQSLRDVYGDEVVTRLRDGVAAANRWGMSVEQGEVATAVVEKLTFSIVLQEMLSGYFNSSQTIFEAYRRVVDLIPGYAFEIIPTPTPPES